MFPRRSNWPFHCLSKGRLWSETEPETASRNGDFSYVHWSSKLALGWLHGEDGATAWLPLSHVTFHWREPTSGIDLCGQEVGDKTVSLVMLLWPRALWQNCRGTISASLCSNR